MSSSAGEASMSANSSSGAPSNIAVQKIPIRLRPVGQAPPLTSAKFQLSGTRPIFEVENFLRKTLQTDKSLFLYCGSGFSPSPDQLLQDLFDCFQVGGELVIMYGIQENWG